MSTPTRPSVDEIESWALDHSHPNEHPIIHRVIQEWRADLYAIEAEAAAPPAPRWPEATDEAVLELAAALYHADGPTWHMSLTENLARAILAALAAREGGAR